MKRKLCLAAVAAVAFAACNEPLVNEPENVAAPVKVSLTFCDGETKSVGTSDENKIANVQVFLFDDSGALEKYKIEKYTSKVVLSSAETLIECLPGEKTIVAIVNAPDMSDVKSIEDLSGRTSYLSDNAEDFGYLKASDTITDRGYYYHDFAEKSLRVIVLDQYDGIILS